MTGLSPGPVKELLAAGGGSLSDGSTTLEREGLHRAIDEVDEFLCDAGIDATQPIVFECANTVQGVLVLLALLERGTSFLLVPPPAPHGPSLELPRFFSHVLSTSPAAPGPVSVSRLEGPRVPPEHAPLGRGRVLLRTSGSLGAAKLVAHPHARLLANARNGVQRLGLGPADRVLIPVPLAHMFGLGAALLPAAFAGASLSLLRSANVLTFLERERELRPTIAFLTPNLCATLLRERASTRDYRHVVVAGDKLGPERFREAEAIFSRVLNLYGSTELGMVSAADVLAVDGPRERTAGRPLPGVALRLAPSEALQGEAGEVGELHCDHPFGFEGYVDPDDGSLHAAERWYDTRDLARLHPGGLVELLGRSDHALKRDGRLVMLVEVERALEQLPGVACAAALVFGATLRGRGIVAFCAPTAGASLEPGQLRRECQALLPAYAVPDELRVLPALPSLPSGKLDRAALQRMLSPPALATNQHG